eukprot:11213569-Lingulodinium_polyedra.AAC.1
MATATSTRWCKPIAQRGRCRVAAARPAPQNNAALAFRNRPAVGGGPLELRRRLQMHRARWWVRLVPTKTPAPLQT